MDHLSPIFFGEKEKKKPPTRLRPRNGHIDHVSWTIYYAKIHGLPLIKNGVDILTFVRKNE